MNQLNGRITEVRTHAGISQIKINTPQQCVFTSVIIENPELATSLKVGKELDILFKETEVIISKGETNNISIQNRIPCTIKAIKTGEILCQLTLLFQKKQIKSIITKNACEQLALQQGDEVFALIKSNEIILSVND